MYTYVCTYISYCVDIINVACVGNRHLRKPIEEALFIFPAVVRVYINSYVLLKHSNKHLLCLFSLCNKQFASQCFLIYQNGMDTFVKAFVLCYIHIMHSLNVDILSTYVAIATYSYVCMYISLLYVHTVYTYIWYCQITTIVCTTASNHTSN